MNKYLSQTELVQLYRQTKNEEIYMEVFNRSIHVVNSLTEMFNEYNSYIDVEAEIIFILNEMIVKNFNPKSRLSFNSHFKLCVIRRMSDFIDKIAQEKEAYETLEVFSTHIDKKTPLDNILFEGLISEFRKQIKECNDINDNVVNITRIIIESLKNE